MKASNFRMTLAMAGGKGGMVTGGDGYSIEHRDGCTIVRGKIPLEQFGAILKKCPEGFVTHGGAAWRIGALAVIGTREGIRALMKSMPPCQAVQEQIARARDSGLPQEAIAWLDSMNRTDAADTMFSVLSGLDILPRSAFRYPSTPNEWMNCRILLEDVPQWRDRLPWMREISREWAQLVDNWDELQALVDGEVQFAAGDTEGYAPRARARMQYLLTLAS